MSTIIGFGASTMQGVGDPGGGFLSRVAALSASSGNAVRIINKGIGGETTRDMLKRAVELESYRPYAVIVQLGCNDFPRTGDGAAEKRTDRTEYIDNVRNLLGAVRGSRSLFISSFVVSEERTGVSMRTFDDRIPAALAAAKTLGYDLWDLSGETRADTSGYLAEDGMHFNAAGHEMIARRVLRWIQQAPVGEAA